MVITPGQERALAPKVSTSSVDTFFSGHNDGGSEYNSTLPDLSQQSLLDTTITGPSTSYYAHNMQHNSHTRNAQSEAQTSESAQTLQNQVHISPSTGVIVQSSVPSTNSVPEFLYQLSKMLTDNNRDIIEWSNGETLKMAYACNLGSSSQSSHTIFLSGKIEVHNPHKLQTHVLNRYFRHSKFASFQRQLNYFGFRKLAGKGKMAPCSYVNDATTKEVGSLLTIKVCAKANRQVTV
jgi:hypothetical protein